MWKISPVPFLKGKRPLVIAHRGDSHIVPENSLSAIEDAVKLKVDVIETDLRVTKDDEIILFHDATVNRTTNDKGTVKSFTLAELKKLDQGYYFEGVNEFKGTFPYRGQGMQIQSLDEILKKFPKMRFNVDIKDKFPKAPKILADKLKELDADDRVMVGSFHQKQLRLFRELSAAPTSAGPFEVLHFRRKVMEWIKKNKIFDYTQDVVLEQEEILGEALPYFALQIPEKFLFVKSFRGPKFFSVSHMLDIAVHVWTVNDPGDMFRLLDWGVDGIFTDKPSLLLDIVEFLMKKKKIK
ncbi:MAG: glycerophosphodiester phosphodiesterase [Asgard group archaeon]|nr:glycerophosphodiester phosphodiesterase [Asgard group archaeon]